MLNDCRGQKLAPHGGSFPIRVVGVTGPPGAGKSTTVGALVSAYRDTGSRVAVLAVDPSSPYSGGALLGDRIRMAAHINDPEVLKARNFVRQALHAAHLGFIHPVTGNNIALDSEIPPDMRELIDELRV